MYRNDIKPVADQFKKYKDLKADIGEMEAKLQWTLINS